MRYTNVSRAAKGRPVPARGCGQGEKNNKGNRWGRSVSYLFWVTDGFRVASSEERIPIYDFIHHLSLFAIRKSISE